MLESKCWKGSKLLFLHLLLELSGIVTERQRSHSLRVRNFTGIGMQAVGEGETLGFLQEVRSREELHEFCLSVIYNFLAVLAQILVEHSF